MGEESREERMEWGHGVMQREETCKERKGEIHEKEVHITYKGKLNLKEKRGSNTYLWLVTIGSSLNPNNCLGTVPKL